MTRVTIFYRDRPPVYFEMCGLSNVIALVQKCFAFDDNFLGMNLSCVNKEFEE